MIKALSDGKYNNCSLTVTDDSENESEPLILGEFIVDTTKPTFSVSNISSSCGNLHFTINAEDENGIRDYYIINHNPGYFYADLWFAADNTSPFEKDIVYDLRTGEYDGFTPLFYKSVNLTLRDRALNISPKISNFYIVEADDNLTYSQGSSGGSPWSIQINNGDVNTDNNTLNLSLKATDQCGIKSYCISRSASDCTSDGWIEVTPSKNLDT